MEITFDKHNYTILVVDDIDTNILLLRILLEKEGYQVVSTNNGAKALEMVESVRPDLILLDIMMPVMDGNEVAIKLKSSPETSDIPIIFLSALSSTNHIIRGFEVGGADYVTKPFNKDELLARVNQQISLINAREVILRQTNYLKKVISDRDKLYSVIAHDLRSPLASVMMVIEMLYNNLTSKEIGENYYELLTMAKQMTQDSFDLLDNLLKWTRTVTGKLHPIMIENIDVNNLVKREVDKFRETAKLKGISIELVGESTSLVTIDTDMIKTVVRNLLSNAIKFSHRDSSVEVGIEQLKERIVVSVTDSGVGVPLEKQDLLFNNSTHFSTEGTDNEAGSGLGLLLSKEFVESNGGELTFTSSYGEGSRFVFTIPIV